MIEEKDKEALEIQEPNESTDYDSSYEEGSSIDYSAENTLKHIAGYVLVVGIIASLFCVATLTTTKVVDPSYHYIVHYNTEFNPVGLAISVGVFLSTLISWALLKVIANISITLKEMNSKMK